jgi:hypothetical protein
MTETVDEIMAEMDRYEWLATVSQDDNGDWHMLYAPAIEPSDESVKAFWDDMDQIIQAPDLDHVTEIANGWIVVKNE